MYACPVLTKEALAELAESMRAAGVARYRSGDVEVELAPYVFRGVADTEPPDTEPEVPRKDGQCAYPGCPEQGGWPYSSQYCRKHGMELCGVR